MTDIHNEVKKIISKATIEKYVKKGLKIPSEKPHLNLVFIGHVDAGKSTTCGNILCTLGQIDSRTLEKYEREAKENNRESWYYAYIMDTNEEERQKGITTEIGKASFELENRRFTILDAPGHKSFVPEMVMGASQADVAILIVSARKGEFEAGFERGGQTQEHAILAKTLGVNTLIVAINKMDEQSIQWDKERYDMIKGKINTFLKSCGYNRAKDVYFVPISGLSGQNIAESVSNVKSKCYEPKASWYDETMPTLFDILSTIELPKREISQALRIPLVGAYRDTGVIAVGKIENGVAVVDSTVIISPISTKVTINSIRINDEEYVYALPGENVELKLTGIDEDTIKKGYVISSIESCVPVTNKLKVQFVIINNLEHKQIITSGYKAVFHSHVLVEECEVTTLIQTIKKSDKTVVNKPTFAKVGMVVTGILKLDNFVSVEEFDKIPQLGRFTLRDEGKTIAVGKIISIANQ